MSNFPAAATTSDRPADLRDVRPLESRPFDARDTRYDPFDGRLARPGWPGVRWGAILCGAVAAIGTQLLLTCSGSPSA